MNCKGLPVPDTCIRTPPLPLPVQHLTIYDLIEDPMWSRFNPFQHNSFKNSTPPLLQTTNQKTPYPEEVNYYRNLHCEESETKSIKVCNFKIMRDQLLMGKKGSGDIESEETKLTKGSSKEVQEKSSIFVDPCGFSPNKSDNKTGTDVEVESDDDGSCTHLSGRPCRFEMFDAENKMCVLSSDGEKRLCCQNLYSIWKKIEKDNGKIRLKRENMKSKAAKKPTIITALGSPDNLATMPREVRQRDKVNLFVPITDNPDRLTFFMDHAKKDEGKTIKTAIDSQLSMLKDLKKLKEQQLSCLNLDFVPFDVESNAGHDVTIWTEDIIM